MGMATRRSARSRMPVKAATLRAEGEDGAGRKGVRMQGLAFRVEGDQRAAACRQGIDARHRNGKVQPGGAAKRRWMPGVVAAGGHNARSPGRRRHPDDGAEVAEARGIVEQDDRRFP